VSDEGQLAPVDNLEGRPPDAYESEYMRGEGMVLYRDKTGSPWQLHAVFGAIVAATIAAAILAPGGWVGAAIGLPVTAIMWLLFSILRVSVSQGHVNVQLGLFGPKIPVAAIESVESLEYDWKEFGGWGIRMNRKGEWMYNLPGDGGRAVKIVWRDRRGKRKVTYVASRKSEELAATIESARTALPAAKANAALPEG
jgi:hypothetical protein